MTKGKRTESPTDEKAEIVAKPYRLTKEEIEALRRDKKECGDEGLAEFEKARAEQAAAKAQRIAGRQKEAERAKAKR